MNKFIAICIASILLVYSTRLQELAKLPILFQHYFEHQSLNEEITFGAYLWEHYSDIPHSDEDEQRDNQLPFKSTDNGNVTLLSLAVPPSNPVSLKLIPTDYTCPSLYFKGDHIPSASGAKIWQPPKALIYSL